jgi:hypothetical protein
LVFVMEKEELRIEIGFRLISVFGWLLHFKGHVAKGLILNYIQDVYTKPLQFWTRTASECGHIK